MRLICKDTNKFSITFFTKGKYAFRGAGRTDPTEEKHDQIKNIKNNNENKKIYTKTP